MTAARSNRAERAWFASIRASASGRADALQDAFVSTASAGCVNVGPITASSAFALAPATSLFRLCNLAHRANARASRASSSPEAMR